jgi:hypothetical protein
MTRVKSIETQLDAKLKENAPPGAGKTTDAPVSQTATPSAISQQIADISKQIDKYIEQKNASPKEISKFLENVLNFIKKQNNLTKDEIAALMQKMKELRSESIIKVGDESYSIDGCENMVDDGNWLDITGYANDIEKQLNELRVSKKIAGYIKPMTDYTKPMSIDDMDSHASAICTFLKNTENFVRQNDLTEEEISMLKQELRKLCGTPIIRCQTGDFSINEYDNDPNCRTIALQAESLEILLDAKACGQVGLERNVPPKIKKLGSGAMNTVQLAHTKPGVDGGEASGPIVVKPCDQSKNKNNPNEFIQGMETMTSYVGPASGSYRRNKASSRVQDMLSKIGEKLAIEVPRVIASVSAAEIKRVSCIAMEMVEGDNIYHCINDTDTQSEVFFKEGFICREMWIQLQDVLTGQIDRHSNNVVLTGDGPVAIDHDLSFPTNPPRAIAGTVPVAIVSSVSRNPYNKSVDGVSYRNYCMPPVIDQEMYEVIMAIDLDKLKNMYEECGLTRSEIDAAMARAEGLKVEARQLQDQDRVIEPSEWASSPQVQRYCDLRNSYAHRHVSRL